MIIAIFGRGIRWDLSGILYLVGCSIGSLILLGAIYWSIKGFIQLFGKATLKEKYDALLEKLILDLS